MSTYSEMFLEYAKNPPNKGILQHPTVIYREENRSCWDSLTVYLRIRESDSGRFLEDFSFEGDTAIVTTAAAAIFWESVLGASLESILKMTYGDVQEMLGTPITPKRQMAACLWLLATRNAIHQYLKDGVKDDFSDVL